MFVHDYLAVKNLKGILELYWWRLRQGYFEPDKLFFPVSCHLGPKGPNGKIVLIRFVHVHKKYRTRVGDRQRKSGYCGILAQKVSVRPSVRPSVRAHKLCSFIKFNHVYDWVLTAYSERCKVYTILEPIICYHYTS